MATELCGSKLISPYFGSSLYVWASVIAVTLGSLAAGYFYGGRLSLKEDRKSKLAGILLLAAIYMGFMPLLTFALPSLAIGMSLKPAVLLTSLLLLAVPMFLMGAASPLIISIQTNEKENAGKISGTVYSVSTLGGIISTFLCGFWLIPTIGLNPTLIVFAVILAASLFLLLQKKNNSVIFLSLILLVVFGFTSKVPKKNCIWEKDGILGKINVIDDTLEESVVRKLLVNNIVQTEIRIKESESNYISDYIQILDSNIREGNTAKALVLGLGGGATSNLLVKKNYVVRGVEFDQNIIDAAKEYFFLDKKVSTVCDDARHFINACYERYGVILVDLFKAEEQPAHVITHESLTKIVELIDPKNGQLIINWHGYSKGDRGLGTAILLNTLKLSGFKYELTALNEDEDHRNIVIFATLTDLSAKKYRIKDNTNTTTLVNKDGQPVLEKYNALANQCWRENYIKYYYSN